MPRVHTRWRTLKETKPSEIALRFLLGGAVTAAIGWVAYVCGPGVGGIFLAFPSILPAGLTLAAHHGGRTRAAEEARGAVAGSFGLVAFALAVRLAPPTWSPAPVLLVACLAWLCASIASWRVALA